MATYLPSRPAYFGGRAKPPARFNPFPHLASIIQPHPSGGGGASGGYLTDAQLRARAQQLVDQATAPLLKALNASYDRQGQQSAASIAAATKEYEHAAQGYLPAVQGAYQQAQGAQAGTDNALAALLKGGGTQAAGELARVHNPEAAAGAGAIGQGAATASFGMGSADLARLLQGGVSEASYGAKLPGLAALTGLQDTRSAQAELGAKRADAISQLLSGKTGNVLSLYQTLTGNQQTAKENAANRAEQEKLTRLTLGTGLEKAQVGAAASALSSGASLQERIRHDVATEQNTQASIDQRRAAAQDRARATSLLHQKQNAAAKVRVGKQRQSAFYATRQKAFHAAAALYKGTTTKAKGGSVFGGGPTGGTVKRPTYTAAYNKLYATYAPQLVNQYGFKQTAVETMIRRALAAAGYTVPAQASGAYGTGSRGNRPG